MQERGVDELIHHLYQWRNVLVLLIQKSSIVSYLYNQHPFLSGIDWSLTDSPQSVFFHFNPHQLFVYQHLSG